MASLASSPQPPEFCDCVSNHLLEALGKLHRVVKHGPALGGLDSSDGELCRCPQQQPAKHPAKAPLTLGLAASPGKGEFQPSPTSPKGEITVKQL